MIGAKITDTAQGRAVVVQISEDHDRTIPLALFASVREMLGIDDMGEVFEAIMHISDNGEPEHDPVTGENVWTDAYQLLRRREESREDAAVEVEEHEGHTDHQVQVAAAQMAHRAVHEPINGGECAMDRCRREARGKLGLPDPSRKCGEESRIKPAPAPDPQPQMMRMMRPAGGKAQVADLLADEADELLACAQRFLHQLSGHDDDRVTPPESEPEPQARRLTADELIQKYGGPHETQ